MHNTWSFHSVSLACNVSSNLSFLCISLSRHFFSVRHSVLVSSNSKRATSSSSQCLFIDCTCRSRSACASSSDCISFLMKTRNWYEIIINTHCYYGCDWTASIHRQSLVNLIAGLFQFGLFYFFNPLDHWDEVHKKSCFGYLIFFPRVLLLALQFSASFMLLKP